MSLIHQIEDMSMNYGSSSRRAIGEFVLQKKGELSRYTIQDIADATYTSKPALVRFAKALGFSGWKDFLKAFLAEVNYQEAHYTDVDPNFPFDENTSTADVVNQLCSLQVESLLDTADLLDHAPIEEAVTLLERSKRIAVFALNPNMLLLQLFTRKMLSIGKNVEFPYQGDVGLLAATLGEEDCAIIASYSGSVGNRPPLNVVPTLQENHVKIIGITSTGDNYLSQNSDYVFNISSRERLYSKISTFATEDSILFILNVLFSCYFKRHYQENKEYKLRRARILESTNRFSSENLLKEMPDAKKEED